jgi:hypothetical protein
MRILFKTLILLLLASSQVLAENQPPPKEDLQRGTTAQLDDNDDRLEKITQIPEIAAAITQFRENSNPKIEEDQPLSAKQWDTFWEGLSGDLQNIVLSKLEDKDSETKSADTTTSPYEKMHNIQLGNFKRKQTKALGALQNYLKDRLQKKLFGENLDDKTKVKAVNNHNVFHELYKTQIGKNLITELANYCIHSDPKTGFVPYLNHNEDKKRALFYRKLNIEEINLYATKYTVEDKDGNEGRAFDRCTANIGISCDNRSSYPSIGDANIDNNDNDNENEKKRKHWFPMVQGQDLSKFNASDFNAPSPCEISRYMTSVKVTLKELEAYAKEVADYNSDKGRNTSIRLETKQEGALDIDSVVNISSGEILNGEGSQFREVAQSEGLKAQECFQQGIEGCESNSYVLGQEESQVIQDEFNLRNRAMQMKIERDLFDNQEVEVEEEDLQKYLEGKGMDPGNIQVLVSKIMKENENNPDFAKEDAYKKIILNRFEHERKALHSSLKARLDKNSRPPEDQPDQIATKAEQLKTSIEESPEQLAQVFQYANVVSSFLSVNNEGGSSSRNTAALVAELNNPFSIAGENRQPAEAPDLSALEQYAEEEPGNTDEQGSSSLGSKEIDQIQFSFDPNREER